MAELSARDYYERGVARYLSSDVDGAIADYSEAIRLDPQLVEVYVARGTAHGETSAALVDYSEAIRINPAYVQAYYNRGLLRSASGDYAGAIADFTRVLQLKPDHPQWRNLRLDIEEWKKHL